MEGFSRRAAKIFESAEEKVSARIEELTKSGEVHYQVAYRDGAPDGVLQFYLLNENFSIASKDEHEIFLKKLLINDEVLTNENAYIIEESGFESFIEIEPRKEMK